MQILSYTLWKGAINIIYPTEWRHSQLVTMGPLLEIEIRFWHSSRIEVLDVIIYIYFFFSLFLFVCSVLVVCLLSISILMLSQYLFYLYLQNFFMFHGLNNSVLVVQWSCIERFDLGLLNFSYIMLNLYLFCTCLWRFFFVFHASNNVVLFSCIWVQMSVPLDLVNCRL